MAVTQYLVDHDELYEKSKATNIVVNELIDHNLQNLADESIINAIMTVYSDDMFSNLPKCQCEESPLVGEFYEGKICPYCNAEVKKPHERMASELWLRSIFVDGKEVKLMSPIIYYELQEVLTKRKKGLEPFNYLDYILDKTVTIPEEFLHTDIHLIVESMLAECTDGNRGYVPFLDNIVKCVDFLANSNGYANRKDGRKAAYNVKRMLDDAGVTQDNLKGVASSYMPILSSKVFVMENNAKGKFVNLKSSMSLTIVKSWMNLCRDIKNYEKIKTRPVTLDRVGNVAAKVAKVASELFISIFKDEIIRKEGIARRQIYGYKVLWSFRGVIVSRIGNDLWSEEKPIRNDPLDGIDVPWKAAVNSLELHITNKLLKRKYCIRDIREHVDNATLRYDEEIHQILEEIKAEAPGGKMPLLAIRNPTLLRGSLMTMHINSIKTDPTDNSIGLNPLLVKIFNGDFDGDNMSFMHIFDTKMADLLRGFSHEYSLYAMKAPCALQGFLTSLSTGNQVIANYLHDKENDYENDRLYDMILSRRNTTM